MTWRLVSRQREKSATSLYERLREREEAERALGNRPLDEVKRELDALIKENKSLTDRLAKRPSEDMVARLEMLERAQEEWEADRARLSQELMAEPRLGRQIGDCGHRARVAQGSEGRTGDRQGPAAGRPGGTPEGRRRTHSAV